MDFVTIIDFLLFFFQFTSEKFRNSENHKIRENQVKMLNSKPQKENILPFLFRLCYTNLIWLVLACVYIVGMGFMNFVVGSQVTT